MCTHPVESDGSVMSQMWEENASQCSIACSSSSPPWLLMERCSRRFSMWCVHLVTNGDPGPHSVECKILWANNHGVLCSLGLAKTHCNLHFLLWWMLLGAFDGTLAYCCIYQLFVDDTWPSVAQCMLAGYAHQPPVCERVLWNVPHCHMLPPLSLKPHLHWCPIAQINASVARRCYHEWHCMQKTISCWVGILSIRRRCIWLCPSLLSITSNWVPHPNNSFWGSFTLWLSADVMDLEVTRTNSALSAICCGSTILFSMCSVSSFTNFLCIHSIHSLEAWHADMWCKNICSMSCTTLSSSQSGRKSMFLTRCLKLSSHFGSLRSFIGLMHANACIFWKLMSLWTWTKWDSQTSAKSIRTCNDTKNGNPLMAPNCMWSIDSRTRTPPKDMSLLCTFQKWY